MCALAFRCWAGLIRRVEAHPLAHVPHRLARQLAASSGPVGERVVDTLRALAQLARAAADRRQLRLHRLEECALAVDATPPRRAAVHRHGLDALLGAERLVKVVDVAHLWRAGVRALHA